MATERVVEWTPSDEPLLTSTDALHEGAVEHFVIRDTTGTYADIKAVCCRRCGYTQEYADVLGTHRCTTPERQDRLAEQGMAEFRRIAERAAGDRWQQIAERLAFQLSDAVYLLKTQAGISDVRSEHDSAERALADFRKMLPPERGVVIPLDREPRR